MTNELPSELWLAIMRLLDSMRDHNAMARTCQLFAALARAEVERSKRRLARVVESGYNYDWDNLMIAEINKIVGPRLANGKHHGHCVAHCTCNCIIEFEAQDGLRQGEARLLRVPKRQLLGTFCFVNDKLEGQEVMYAAQYVLMHHLVYYEDGKREGLAAFWSMDRLIHWQRFEHGRREGCGVSYRDDGFPSSIYDYEDDLPVGVRTSSRNNSSSMAHCHELVAGWLIDYYDNGSLHDLTFYEDGKSEGYAYTWHDNGQLARIYRLAGGLTIERGPAWDRNGNPIGI